MHVLRARAGGIDPLDKLVAIDWTPIGHTLRLNLGSYVDSPDPIRASSADLPEARARRWTPGHLSRDAKGGGGEAGRGKEARRISMHFLSDVEVPCGIGGGARFDRGTPEVRRCGRTIADMPSMTRRRGP